MLAWTSERLEQLRRLAARGKSGGEIAEIMAVSRNAIMGKAFREGIHLESSPLVHRSRTKAAAKAAWDRDDGSRRRAAAERQRLFMAVRGLPAP